MRTRLFLWFLGMALIFKFPLKTNACTGITLKSESGTTIVARTIEWGGGNLK